MITSDTFVIVVSWRLRSMRYLAFTIPNPLSTVTRADDNVRLNLVCNLVAGFLYGIIRYDV